MIATSWRPQRIPVAAAGGCLFMLGIYTGWYLAQDSSFVILKPWGDLHSMIGSDSSPAQPHQHAGSDSVNPACLTYPSVDSDVVVVVKTGATEALSRIPVQLLTFLSCATDDVLIFSDMEQEIGGFHVHDAIVDVVPQARTVNSDFDLYEIQKQLKLFGGDIASLSRATEAWALDKYKNIHTAQKAWELRPNRSWYLFIDADTYVVWSSFFAWLKRLDPAKDRYLGNTIHTLNLFAHGGSGYVVSRAGMLEIVGGKDASKIAADFDISASTTCCGDAELAVALDKKNVSLTDAYPLFNNHKPRDMLYGPMHWCQPVVTMHHMSPEEINDLWQFEQLRPKPESPLLFEELFSAHMFPKMSSNRTDWDNLSDEPTDDQVLAELAGLEGREIKEPEGKKEIHKREETIRDEITKSASASAPAAFTTTTTSKIPQKPSHPTFYPPTPNPTDPDHTAVSACAVTCRSKPSCFQYLWNGHECKYSTQFFTLGNMREVKEGEGRWVSGWDLERIGEFQRRKSGDGKCGEGL